MLPRFTGDLTQAPPAYSAIKVEGERAYDLARDGEEVEPGAPPGRGLRGPPAGSPDPDQAEFEILCGKGTYVRAWVRDLALALGTLGHVSAASADPARRPFGRKSAIGLETLTGFYA